MLCLFIFDSVLSFFSLFIHLQTSIYTYIDYISLYYIRFVSAFCCYVFHLKLKHKTKPSICKLTNHCWSRFYKHFCYASKIQFIRTISHVSLIYVWVCWPEILISFWYSKWSRKHIFWKFLASESFNCGK